MSDDQSVEAKRKRDNLAEEASAREYLRRRHNFQVKLNSGRRAADPGARIAERRGSRPAPDRRPSMKTSSPDRRTNSV